MAESEAGTDAAAAAAAVAAAFGAEEEAAEPTEKRQRTEEDEAADEGAGTKRVKRKMALVFGFCGQKYRGLQINYEIEKDSKKKSVEEVMRQALVRAGAVTEVNAERLEQKIGWARSSRTDQGVSAAKIVVSAKLLVHEESLSATGHSAALVAEVNKELPEDIRCFSAVKVPNSFDAKRACSWRTYDYLLPLSMARRADGSEDSMAPEDAARRLEEVMRRFEGCHSFHNFTRLKASDLVWKEEKEGKDKGGKGKGKGKKGKGKSKGKKRPAEEEEEEGGDVEVEDGGPGDLEVPVEKSDGAAKPFVEPPWVEICAKAADTGEWRERSPQVMKHTQSTIFMCSVESTCAGALLRIRLCGKFFLYNQIRLMVGTAAAIASGALPKEFMDMALGLKIEMHMPLAPPTGLLLRTAGFCEMDQRAGFCAMDTEQAASCMLPEAGFVLVPGGESESLAKAFGGELERKVELQWQETGELKEWQEKLAGLRLPSAAIMEELQGRLKAAEAEEAEFRESQASADRRRREERLATSSTFVGVMPRRFAADLMVRFRLTPGWRVTNLQHALSVRMRGWEKNGDKPEGLSSPPSTLELLDYIEKVGLDTLSEEGRQL